MSGYEVVIEMIDPAAKAAARAAEGVQPVELGGTLTGVAQGIPGGTAVEAARLLSSMWTREIPAWAKNMDDYSAQLSSAAQHYRSNEDAAAYDLRVVATHGPRPV
ncbi:hypothetical protein [Amycolatopsis sp. NPDC059657]|uniref:hypothetical protein n=1 Tax=Amycolatopsis sp. NPDC059657 TaxID=3346899 RepID=UPI00366FB2EC